METGTVLLVFEELRDLETYGNMLCSLGYRILVCNSTAEGIKALKTEDLSFVIVSQGTPAFEGRQVLEKAHELRPNVPALIIARVLDRHSYCEAMDLGAIDYLVRPEPPDMAWVIDTQLRRSETA
jgi:DNA-binding NtrC family response regulator